MFRKLMFAAVAGCTLGLAAFGCNSMKGDDKSMSSDSSMMAPKGDIIDVATGPGMERVTTLVTAVKAAGLVDTLKGPGPFTVLAPTNEAFAKLPPGTVEELLKPENKEKLKGILLYHVISGRHPASEVMSMSSTKAVTGEAININTSMGKTTVGNDKATATIIKTDVPATNGVIHWVDTVLMP